MANTQSVSDYTAASSGYTATTGIQFLNDYPTTTDMQSMNENVSPQFMNAGGVTYYTLPATNYPIATTTTLYPPYIFIPQTPAVSLPNLEEKEIEKEIECAPEPKKRMITFEE